MTQRLDFSQLKRTITVVQVLSACEVPLDRYVIRGDKVSGPCPLPAHRHDNPAGSNRQQWKSHRPEGYDLWRCFSCGASGDVVTLAKLLTGLDDRGIRLWFLDKFPQVARQGQTERQTPAAQQTVTEAPREDETVTTELASLSFRLQLDTNGEVCREYLASRGITVETATHFGVGLTSRGMMRGRLCFPVYRPGAAPEEHPCGYCGRWIGAENSDVAKYLWPKDFAKRKVLFGFREALADSPAYHPIVLVENPFAVLALHQLGLPAACCFGARLSAEQADMLAAGARPVIVAFDGDAAGRDGSLQAENLLRERGCFVVRVLLPDGTQPDTMDPTVLRRLLNL